MADSTKLSFKKSFPVRKGLHRRFPGRYQQFADELTPPQQMFEHLFERLEIEAVPFTRYFLLNFVEHGLSDFQFHPSQPGLERFEAAHRLIDTMTRVKSSERSVRKIPFAGIETEPLIDHLSPVTRFILCAVKDSLAPVRVAGPLVEDEHAAKIGKIHDLTKPIVTKNVVNRDFRRGST